MERRRSLSTLRRGVFLGLALLAVAALTTACEENPVGRKCFIGVDDPNSSESVVASPALECPSRTCLRVPLQRDLPEGSEYANLCTGECQDDGDCDRMPESPCQLGFTCAIPVVVGPFCCRRLCVCKDYLIVPEGGVPVPAACNPSDPANTCCNLPDRENLPQCQ